MPIQASQNDLSLHTGHSSSTSRPSENLQLTQPFFPLPPPLFFAGTLYPSVTPVNDNFDFNIHIRSLFANQDMAYPSPELFATPGPYQSTINYRYLKQHGFLPDTELALELLQEYLLDDIPGGGIRSDLPAGRDIQDHLSKDQHSQNQIINHNQSCGVNAHDGAVQFRQGASLALVPFLGPSPAEIYGGPLGECTPAPLPPVPESSPQLQQVDQKTAGAPTSHPPMIGECLPSKLP